MTIDDRSIFPIKPLTETLLLLNQRALTNFNAFIFNEIEIRLRACIVRIYTRKLFIFTICSFAPSIGRTIAIHTRTGFTKGTIKGIGRASTRVCKYYDSKRKRERETETPSYYAKINSPPHSPWARLGSLECELFKCCSP